MEHFILAIFVLLFGAVFVTFVKEKYKLLVTSLASIISTISAIMSAFYVLLTGNTLSCVVEFPVLYGNVLFEIDQLSAIFIVVISLMSSLGIFYARDYMKPYLNKKKDFSSHCFFLLLLVASMLLVTTVKNCFFFLVIWEIMSLSSFFLILFDAEKKEVRKAAVKYLIYMHLSIIFIIAMFANLSNLASSFDFNEISNILVKNPTLANLSFLLGFIGFGIKAGFVPFHNWLPDAHPAAPSHVSGIMSGVMIKTGIYGILRMITLIGVPSKSISYVVLAISVLSALYGVLYVITQRDIKRFLAYSSIENIGIIGIGIGIGMLGLAYSNPLAAIFGFAGAILHVLNHSIFKELLFFASGNVYLKTHTKNIEELGGLIKKMPLTALMFIIGSVAISGLPPFNGFISEFLIYAGMFLGIPSSEISLFVTLVISIAALALVGTMAILCFSKATGVMFLGEPRSVDLQNIKNDVEKNMLVVMSLLSLASLLIGLFPQYVIKFILSPVYFIVRTQSSLSVFNNVVYLLQYLSNIFFIFLLVLILFVLVRKFINKKSRNHNTWGCGYDRANSHMQYTASSYANLFVSTLKPLFKRISHIKKPKELFPKEAYFELEIEDIEEAYIVEPIIKLDEKILAKFERIQNGNMQQYILFGLIFLVVAIICLLVFGG